MRTSKIDPSSGFGSLDRWSNSDKQTRPALDGDGVDGVLDIRHDVPDCTQAPYYPTTRTMTFSFLSSDFFKIPNDPAPTNPSRATTATPPDFPPITPAFPLSLSKPQDSSWTR
ncbi:hypothetical protein FB451DRAFT_1411890 [Mycena latifolia]|nr:hypothetical protein FB451DRAFT_1411890 [Mycena latifolia]